MDNQNSLSNHWKSLITAGAAVALAALIAFLIYHRHHKKPVVNPEFGKYIESYTSGIVSKESTIRVKLAGDIPTTHVQNEALSDDVFSFSPSIKGKAYWVDASTIEFRPQGRLDPDKSYSAEFRLSKVTTVPSQFETFNFGFQTIKPDFTVSFAGLQTAASTSLDKMKLSGTIQTADTEDPGGNRKNHQHQLLLPCSYQLAA